MTTITMATTNTLRMIQPAWFRHVECQHDDVRSIHAVHLRSIHCAVLSSGTVIVFLRIPS